MCVCFGRVSLHCFYSCTPGIIYGPIFSRCMGVASRWNYNGECMTKIFQGGGGGGQGWWTPSKHPSPYEQLLLLSTPCFNMFLERSLMNPSPHFKHLSLLPPSPSTTPSPPNKNVARTLRCSAFHGVYNMSVVSVMFLYPSRNDGGPHRNCTLYTRVILVPSAFLRKL